MFFISNQAVKRRIRARVVNAADIFTALYDVDVGDTDDNDGDVQATDLINVVVGENSEDNLTQKHPKMFFFKQTSKQGTK